MKYKKLLDKHFDAYCEQYGERLDKSLFEDEMDGDFLGYVHENHKKDWDSFKKDYQKSMESKLHKYVKKVARLSRYDVAMGRDCWEYRNPIPDTICSKIEDAVNDFCSDSNIEEEFFFSIMDLDAEELFKEIW